MTHRPRPGPRGGCNAEPPPDVLSSERARGALRAGDRVDRVRGRVRRRNIAVGARTYGRDRRDQSRQHRARPR